METDIPLETQVDHKQVLETLSAMCTHCTLVKRVVPELIQHANNLFTREFVLVLVTV